MKECLAEACNNTFVLIDCLNQTCLEDKDLQYAHERLKEEERDDALILVDGRIEGNSFSAQMVVLGLDGALGEYCGNGARACAAYLFAHYGSYGKLFLRTGNFYHRLLQLGKEQFSVTLPPVRFALNPKFIAPHTELHSFEYVEAIEPHLVIEQDMSDEELLSIGRKLNGQKDLFPLGINVNAWHYLASNAITVKTYERGVQRLTKSCGTGSISCVASLLKAQNKLGAIDVITPGGPLKIIVREDEIELCGEGKI